jgi:hypothetical protein
MKAVTALAGAALFVATTAAAQEQQPPQQPQQEQQKQQGAMIKVPADAKLVGQAEVAEIRTLPELTQGAEAARKPQAAKVLGVKALDKVYHINKGYQEVVAHFDQQFKQSGYESQARVTTPNSTAWTVQKPDGTIANVVVRNTRPTSFEVIEVQAAAATP